MIQTYQKVVCHQYFNLLKASPGYVHEDIDIEHVSQKIKSSGFAPLVEFLIESHVPAFTILHSIFLCSKPFMVPFVSSASLGTIDSLLQNSELRDQLLMNLSQTDVQSEEGRL